MKRLLAFGLLFTIAGGYVLVDTASAQIVTTIVHDTWLDGDRDYPASTDYSEWSIDQSDSDGDGDMESAWFAGGAGDLEPAGSGGPLRLTQGSNSSSSLTTYFTAEGDEITLDNPGDSLKIKWQYEVDGSAPTSPHSSHSMRVAIVDSPSLSRVSSETSPGSASYRGYALFMETDTSLTRSDPFELEERADTSSAALLSSSGAWSQLADDGPDDGVGYFPGNLYTFLFSVERQANGDLLIESSITGGGLSGGDGMSISYLDTDPDPIGGYVFDTFEFRPDGHDRTHDVLDTYLFEVQFCQAVPEPASICLLLMAGVGLVVWRRRQC